MTAPLNDSLAAVLSAPLDAGLDACVWAPPERHLELRESIADIAGRLGVAAAVPEPEAPGTDLPQLLAAGGREAPIVVILDRHERLPIELCARFVHLELDGEPLLDPRLGRPRALLEIDARRVATVRAAWSSCFETARRTVERFREQHWQDCYREGQTFSPLARRALPRPWTYRLATGAAAAAAMWRIEPGRLIRGCIGPRLGTDLTETLLAATEQPPSPLAESV